MRKHYTKESFCECIPWIQIEQYLTKKEYKDFMKLRNLSFCEMKLG